MRRAAAILFLLVTCGVAGFVGGLLASLYGPITPPTGVPEALRVKRIEVIDERGRVAAQLSPGGLDIIGHDGRVRATLRLQYNDKGVLGFSDGRSEGRALFGFLGTDVPSEKDDDWGLRIYAPDSRDAVVSLVTINKGKRGALFVRDQAPTP